MKAKPKRLRSGSWGAVVEGQEAGQVAKGDVVTITARGGKSWDAVVEKVIWRGGDVAILATEQRPAKPRTEREASYLRSRGHSVGSYQYQYCGYPCPVSGRRCCATNGPCHDCE